jgi:hypothetical protein
MTERRNRDLQNGTNAKLKSIFIIQFNTINRYNG